MSERLPYGELPEERLTDLPLPDEDLAWEDMRRRLEEDDDDKPVIVWWRRGCMLWGLLLLGLMATGWWFFYHDNKKPVTDKKETSTEKEIVSTIPNRNSPDEEKNVMPPVDRKPQVDSIPIKGNLVDSVTNHDKPQKPAIDMTIRTTPVTNDITPVKKKKIVTQKKTRDDKIKSPDKQNRPIGSKPGKPAQTPAIDETNLTAADNTSKDNNRVKSSDTVSLPVSDRKDSLPQKAPVDTIARANTDSTVQQTKKQKQKQDHPKFFSAGIAAQIQVNNVTSLPENNFYNSLGRESSWRDYLPSIYGRWNKLNRWFIQLEFRYGAPQRTKEIVYKKEIIQRPGGNQIFDTRLGKTYYHQLPLTFHYNLIPGLTIGSGISLNKFNSAISYREERTQSPGGDSLLSVQRFTATKDSAFANTYFQGILETQYQWKRLSLGARYSFGLQPYVKFTLPGGPQQKETSKTIYVFLRYELWRSKMK